MRWLAAAAAGVPSAPTTSTAGRPGRPVLSQEAGSSLPTFRSTTRPTPAASTPSSDSLQSASTSRSTTSASSKYTAGKLRILLTRAGVPAAAAACDLNVDKSDGLFKVTGSHVH